MINPPKPPEEPKPTKAELAKLFLNSLPPAATLPAFIEAPPSSGCSGQESLIAAAGSQGSA